MARSTGQRYFKHKMTVFDPIDIIEGGVTLTQGTYALQQPEKVGPSSVRGFDSTVRWAQTYKQYEEYAITGMKIRWIPGNVRGSVVADAGSAATAWVGSMFLYFDIDTYDTSAYNQSIIAQLDKNWVFDPTRTWSKYFSCKNLSRMQNVAWQDTRDYASQTFNSLTKASLGYLIDHQIQANQPLCRLGYFKVSYYVTFRGQSNQGI